MIIIAFNHSKIPLFLIVDFNTYGISSLKKCSFLFFSPMVCSRNELDFLKGLTVARCFLLDLYHLACTYLAEGEETSEAACDLLSLRSFRLNFLLSDEGIKGDATLALQSLIENRQLLPFLMVDRLKCESGGFFSHEPISK